MSDADLLTDADLVELTGYVQPEAQIRVLRDHGMRPVIRRDGRARITWSAVTRAMIAGDEVRNDGSPDFEALRKTG